MNDVDMIEQIARRLCEAAGYDPDMKGLAGRPRWLMFAPKAEYVVPLLAEAWDEGHRTPQKREPHGCQCGAWYEGECACGLFGTGKIITPNPYRQKEQG